MALTPLQLNVMRGHPTAPGPKDPYTAKRGRADTPDGTPSVPRVHLAIDGTSHADGIPQGATGPFQPGVTYEGENTTAIPWIAQVEAHRQELQRNLRDTGTPD